MGKHLIVNDIMNILSSINLINKEIAIDENTSLYNECNINSIDIIEVIVQIEEKYNFEFNDSELSLKDFETISSIADIVLARNEKED